MDGWEDVEGASNAVAEAPSRAQQALSWPDRARKLVVQSAEDYSFAADLLLAIKELAGKIKDDWKDAKKKAHDAHKAVVAQEKKHLDPLEEAEKIIKATMLTWRKAAEQAQRAAEAESGESAAPVVPVVKGISTSKHWSFRVMDHSKIPDKYWKPRELDTDAIGQVVRAMGPEHGIDGIEAYEAESMRASSR